MRNKICKNCKHFKNADSFFGNSSGFCSEETGSSVFVDAKYCCEFFSKNESEGE